MSPRLRWPVVIVASTALMGLLVAADAGGPIRLLVTFWFMFFCPGLAIVPLFWTRSRGEEMVLAFAVSIILDTILATAIIEVANLSPTSGFITLAAVCLIGCALQVLRPSEIGAATLAAPSDPQTET